MRRFTAFVLGLCLSLPVLAEQVQRFGDLDVHYNVFNSSFLQPNVASAVGLVRSKAQGVINVVPMEKGKPVEASVTGSAKDLTGKVIPLEFRRVSEEGAHLQPGAVPDQPARDPGLHHQGRGQGRTCANLQFQQGNLPGRMIKLEQLVLASHNAGKLKELQAMLGASVKVRSIGEFSQVEPEETGLSFVENAILKARNAARLSGLPALADDSGLAVDFLGGAPGIYSARYADGRGDAANNAKLLEAMKDVPDAERGAQFVSVLALVRHADDPLPILCEGIWEGRILREARGAHGFGYDPLFWVPERDCSSAELAPEEKNRLSHRARAMALLKQRLGL